MNLACRSRPISYLRLERYLQGDVDASERRRVADHLRECACCRTCFEDMQSEVIELPPLRVDPARPVAPLPVLPLSAANVRPRLGPWSQLTAALALAAAVLLWLRAPNTDSALPPARVAIKGGGELALELVREHAGSLAVDPSRFAPEDRFQARVSCPPGKVYWELVVFQAGQAFFPLSPAAPLQCANAVTLPMAFALDGTEPADVCVVIDPNLQPARSQLSTPLTLPARSAACTTVSPL